jgi:hypothetical protein
MGMWKSVTYQIMINVFYSSNRDDWSREDDTLLNDLEQTRAKFLSSSF